MAIKILEIKNENLNLYLIVKTWHDNEKQLKFDVINSPDESHSSMSEENDVCNILNFIITLSHNQWNAIFDENQKLFKCFDGKNNHCLFYTLTSYIMKTD